MAILLAIFVADKPAKLSVGKPLVQHPLGSWTTLWNRTWVNLAVLPMLLGVTMVSSVVAVMLVVISLILDPLEYHLLLFFCQRLLAAFLFAIVQRVCHRWGRKSILISMVCFQHMFGALRTTTRKRKFLLIDFQLIQLCRFAWCNLHLSWFGYFCRRPFELEGWSWSRQSGTNSFCCFSFLFNVSMFGLFGRIRWRWVGVDLLHLLCMGRLRWCWRGVIFLKCHFLDGLRSDAFIVNLWITMWVWGEGWIEIRNRIKVIFFRLCLMPNTQSLNNVPFLLLWIQSNPRPPFSAFLLLVCRGLGACLTVGMAQRLGAGGMPEGWTRWCRLPAPNADDP